MLADPRARRWSTTSPAQWLHLRERATRPRPIRGRFPISTRTLRRAMRRETELFVAASLREDRSVIELLTADYTFLNERLARHYGIPASTAISFRRVTLTDDAAPRPARAGQPPDGHVVRRTARRRCCAASGCSTTCSARRRRRRRPTFRRCRKPTRRRQGADDARARWSSTAPNPVMRQLPCADGPARLRARKFRCGRAGGAREAAEHGDRRVGRAAGRHDASRARADLIAGDPAPARRVRRRPSPRSC